MKTYFLLLAVCSGLLLPCCGKSLLDSTYTLEFPALPQTWNSLLGSPYWKLEWLNTEGRLQSMTIRPNSIAEISLPVTWASPVSALPYWPNRGLQQGIFKPAGAIFPFDVSGKSIILSWQGGVDANLYWEFIKAAAQAGQETVIPDEGAEVTVTFSDTFSRALVSRLPMNFDWPRFRLLFDDPTVNAEVRADPWLADWQSIALKIVQSGFDKRRLVPETRSSLSIPATGAISCGPWIGSSPFAAPLLFEPDTAMFFPVRQSADTWVCAQGILRCNTDAWIFLQRQ